MSWRWLAMNQPGSSAAENELWVPAKTTSLSRSVHSAGEPLQPSDGLATALSRGPGARGEHDHRGDDDRDAAAPTAIARPRSVRLRTCLLLRRGAAAAAEQQQQLAGAEVDELGAGQQSDDAERERPVERDDEARRRSRATPRSSRPAVVAGAA